MWMFSGMVAGAAAEGAEKYVRMLLGTALAQLQW
jgi:hypothetical protein